MEQREVRKSQRSHSMRQFLFPIHRSCDNRWHRVCYVNIFVEQFVMTPNDANAVRQLEGKKMLRGQLLKINEKYCLNCNCNCGCIIHDRSRWSLTYGFSCILERDRTINNYGSSSPRLLSQLSINEVKLHEQIIVPG